MTGDDPRPDTVDPNDDTVWSSPEPTASSDSSRWVGRTLRNLYRVDRLVGQGEWDPFMRWNTFTLKKTFAVKVLSESISQDKAAVERLKQEAIAASRIDHEHIVDVVNLDVSSDGHVFIVMEMLDGQSLATVLEDGAPPIGRSLKITIQIAEALTAAHQVGIVHRDLKPENIMILKRGGEDFVKVLDFGISKVRSAEAEQVRVTQTGQLLGTPLYMSPEQAKGEIDIDHRSDIYSLGVLLYELITGDPPFIGQNYFQLLWKHSNQAPTPPRLAAPSHSIPENLERIVLRALEKNPEERFNDMEEMAAALREVLAGLDERTSPPKATWRVSRVIALVGLPIVLVALGAWVWGGTDNGHAGSESLPEPISALPALPAPAAAAELEGPPAEDGGPAADATAEASSQKGAPKDTGKEAEQSSRVAKRPPKVRRPRPARRPEGGGIRESY